jgi:hypothetical protein
MTMTAEVINFPRKPQSLPLPDEGPWQLLVFKGRVLALSQTSGLYEVEATRLRKVELKGGPDVG